MAMNPQTKIPNNLKQYSTASSKATLPSQQNSNNVNNYYINSNERPQLQPINTNVSQDKAVNMNYPMVQTQVVQMVQQPVYQQQVYTPVQQNSPQVYNNAQYVITQPQNNPMMTPTSAVGVDQMTPTMNNSVINNVVVSSPQIITYQQQQGQIITTQVTPITTYAQEGLGQSEVNNGEMINTPTMINTPIVYTTVSSTTQSSPVSLESEEIVFGDEQENKDEYIYACEVKGCGRRFKRAEFLRRHQRCHKTDSGYGKEMLQRQSSVKVQAPYVIKTQSPQTVSYIPSTGITTPISSHPITQMPSPPTTDVSYNNVVVKNDMCKPISPNESTGAYYAGEVSPVAQTQTSPIIVTTAGTMYTSDVVTTSQTVNGSTLFPSITDSQTTFVQTPIVQADATTSVCQMPSPPLQYQPNYTQVTYQTQSQPVYTTTTPIY
jgi:hypothetical protein